MTTKPEALRLADEYSLYMELYELPDWAQKAAAELRRQHAEIERLTLALESAESLCRQQGRAIGVLKCKNAIEAA